MVTVEFLSAVKYNLSQFVLEREKLLSEKNFRVYKDKHLPSKRKNLYIQENEKLRKILAEIRNTMFYKYKRYENLISLPSTDYAFFFESLA